MKEKSQILGNHAETMSEEQLVKFSSTVSPSTTKSYEEMGKELKDRIVKLLGR